MTVARDMTKERAEEFQILCSAALYDSAGNPLIVVGCGQAGRNSLSPYGLSYDVLMNLAHHRLINSDMSSELTLSNSPSSILPAVVNHQGSIWTLLWSSGSGSPNTSHPIPGLLLTSAGKELYHVVERIPVPEYTQAMFEYLKKQGWTVNPVSRAS